jgi:hypothetical protein
MELAANALSPAELAKQLDGEIVGLQETVDQWPHLRRAGSVSGWDEVNRSASLARRIASRRGTMNTRGVKYTEVELRSKDGRLVGRPDCFWIGSNEALLREYKSGPLHEPGGQLVRDHIDQLRFYSHLVFENFSVEHVVCYLESLIGDAHEMVIARKEASAFAAEVLKVVDHVNAQLLATKKASSLARPSKAACSGCDVRTACIAFKDRQDQLELTGAEFILEGVVKAISFHATAPMADVVLTDEKRRVVNIVALPLHKCEGISVGTSYAFLNLRRFGEALIWDQTSRILLRDRI